MALVMVWCTSAFLDAQAQGGTTGHDNGAETYINVNIYKIRMYKNAYVITYAKHDVGSGQLIIPFGWVATNPNRLQVRSTDNPVLPYLSVFYNEQGMDCVKLTLPRSRQHPMVEYVRKEVPQGSLPVDSLEGFTW
jgi:hypothetical protein